MNRNSAVEATVHMNRFSTHALHAEWEEILVLVSGMIPSRVVGPCLQCLLEAEQLFLAARCVAALEDHSLTASHEAVQQALTGIAQRWREEIYLDSGRPSIRALEQMTLVWKDTTTRDALLDFARVSERDEYGGLQGCAVLRLLESYRSDGDVCTYL